MAWLATGDTNARSADFPDAGQRRAIARALAASSEAHQSVGATLAQTLQVNQKMDERLADEHHASRRKDLGHELSSHHRLNRWPSENTQLAMSVIQRGKLFAAQA